jgi:hypothetical protein
MNMWGRILTGDEGGPTTKFPDTVMGIIISSLLLTLLHCV